MTSDQTAAPAARDEAGTRDIAVIGMAVRMPEADDAQQFLENLRTGRDSVRELSAERRSRTSMSADAEYQLNGYIEDIDSFDHAFFGISKGEAQNMAPEHRLLLQVAYQAVENAGYDPAALKDRRASVYVGDTRLMYQQLARTVEPTMVMGTHASATAGRISRFFGLRGPAAMVDSSCSSALLAVHHAVNDLLLGDAELALVCGINLNLFGEPKHGEDELDLGIRSADGKTRTFSADADGTGSGEAVATVLLKPLDQALRDGDPVHAVIKGIAANNVAGRSSTLTAPDSAAQAEVIERAWAKAGIDPTTVSYIEAHGTATRLGDPIEIEAIDLAFGRVTDEKHFCALSSAKSNIGHTWSASGLVGLVKAVLALRHRQLFPNLHSQTLSPLINFADSAVSVTQDLTPWEPAAGVRRAGVSSFGVMGTNVHAVLGEAPTREEEAAAPREDGYWVPVSAKSATALQENIAALRQWLADRPELRIEDVQRTLVDGRGHYPYRACVTSGDLAGLSSTLAVPATVGPESTCAVTVLLVSGRCTASPEVTGAFRRAHPRFDLLYTQVEQAAGSTAADPRVGQFAFQYAMYGLLRHLGLEFRHVVGEGAGKHVIDASAGRVELREALRRAVSEHGTEVTDLDARVDRLLAKMTGDQRVMFVEAGPLSTVSAALTERDGAGYAVVAVPERLDAYAAFLRDLYLGGAHWTWRETAGAGRRIELPSYQFDRVRCWLDEANTVTADAATTGPAPAGAAALSRPADVLSSVLQVWMDVLGMDALDADASFFDLGGDSISGTQVLNRLQTVHGIELDPFAIFDHETPRALTEYIETELGAGQPAEAEPVTQPAEQPAAEAEPPGTDPFPVSPAQLHIWMASQFEGGSVAFNLTRTFELTGAVDTEALQRALDALAGRHDALRASFSFVDEVLRQRIAPKDGFTAPLELRSLDGQLVGTPAAADLLREFAARRFDLQQGPLLRAQLASFRTDRHLLTLSTHHIVADGWSLGLLVRDLGALYASFARGATLELPEVGVRYREYHLEEAQRAQSRREQAAAYWLERYQEPVPTLDLPVRSDAGGPGFIGAYRNYSLPPELWQRLKSFSQSEGGTAFTSVLSAFAAVFSGYSEHGELVLGTSIAGRSRQSLEQLVGMLVRMLPLRLRAGSQSSFRELYEQVRGTFADALRNVDYPYEELVQELQRSGRAHAPNLFDVLIEFEQFAGSGQPPLSAMAGPALQVTPVEVTLDTSVFPLNIMLAEQAATLEAAIRFDTRLFDEHTVDQLWSAFASLLEAALADPSAPLEKLPLLSEREELRERTSGRTDSQVGELPLTSDGKVDHKALERREALRPRTADALLPRTDDERALTEIWQEVLGVDGIGVTDRFFDVGGNSLRAIKVLARIHGRLGVKLGLETLFAQPTIAGLAAVLVTAQMPAVEPIASLGGPGAYDAACTQDLLLEIERTSPQRGAFHRNDLHELRGSVDHAVLERSFALLVERHESLRTTYGTVAGRAVQTVHAPGILPLSYRVHDLSGQPEEAVRAFVKTRIGEPFDIAEQPLVRADLIRTGEDSHLLVTSMHQLVSDGSSAQVLQRDWHELYEALAAGRDAELPQLEVQYKDAAAWRNGRLTPELRAEHREFWLQELEGASSFISVPADLPRPAVSALAGTRLRLPLPAGLTEQFAALASRHAVTEFMVARCAVGLLLAGAGNTDVTMGTYTLGRNRLDLENQIGFHINTVPLRFRLQPDDDVRSVLTRTQNEVLRAFQHEDYPYGEIMRDLGWKRGPDRSPVFDVVVALDQLDAVPDVQPTSTRIEFVAQELPRRSKEADLMFVFLRSADSLDLAMTYNSEIFSPERAQSILSRLRTVVEAMVAERPIIEILKQEESPK
ncbi:condensation domain-containing protein [Streptomyces sp. NPDC005181]|uniref:condensation domain-containing protein n=1 Tax=Streptomyces sp. NPDC005181 TaxID=3156869 RepID=UPI0033A02F1F